MKMKKNEKKIKELLKLDEENGINELHKHIAHLKSETKMQDVFFVARLDCYYYYYYVLFIISETIFILTF